MPCHESCLNATDIRVFFSCRRGFFADIGRKSSQLALTDAHTVFTLIGFYLARLAIGIEIILPITPRIKYLPLAGVWIVIM